MHLSDSVIIFPLCFPLKNFLCKNNFRFASFYQIGGKLFSDDLEYEAKPDLSFSSKKYCEKQLAMLKVLYNYVNSRRTLQSFVFDITATSRRLSFA